MVEYLQALHAVRDILSRFPEVKQLIKQELNSQGSYEYVEYHENQPATLEPQSNGTVPTDGVESTGPVLHEVGSGNVHDRSASSVQSAEAIEPEAVIKND